MATTTTLREKYGLPVDDEVLIALDRAQDSMLDAEAALQQAGKQFSAALNLIGRHLSAERRFELLSDLDDARAEQDKREADDA